LSSLQARFIIVTAQKKDHEAYTKAYNLTKIRSYVQARNPRGDRIIHPRQEAVKRQWRLSGKDISQFSKGEKVLHDRQNVFRRGMGKNADHQDQRDHRSAKRNPYRFRSDQKSRLGIVDQRQIQPPESRCEFAGKHGQIIGGAFRAENSQT
jgi:hypothetical protein